MHALGARDHLGRRGGAALKILIINPYPILPPLHGGRARTAGLAEGLARSGATVVVLSPWGPGQPLHGMAPGGYEIRSTFFATNPLPRLVPGRLISPLALLSLQPLGAPRRRLARFADFDIFQFDFCAHARWISLVPPTARVVYSAHNVERDFWGPGGPGPGPGRRGRWGERIERLEGRLMSASDLVVSVSDADARRLTELYGAPRRLAVVPQGFDNSLLGFDRNGIRAASRQALGLRPSERALLFLGGPARHNREAAAFLVEDVLPHLDPGTVLLLVGCSGNALPAATDRRVRRFGFADDLAPYLAAADIAVNPVEGTCGASVKLIHCLAAGLPVVSTPSGARGFAVLPAGVRIAPREEIVAALRAPLDGLVPDRAALAHRAWPRLGADLHALYADLLTQR